MSHMSGPPVSPSTGYNLYYTILSLERKTQNLLNMEEDCKLQFVTLHMNDSTVLLLVPRAQVQSVCHWAKYD